MFKYCAEEVHSSFRGTAKLSLLSARPNAYQITQHTPMQSSTNFCPQTSANKIASGLHQRPGNSRNQALHRERVSGSVSSDDLEIYSVTGPINYTTPSRSQQHADAISRSFGINRQAATSMLNKQPQLVDFSTEDLLKRFSALSRLLRLSRESCLSLICMYPFLLVKNTSEVSQGIARIVEVMGVEAEPVCKLICKQPYVLQSSSQFLKSKFDALCNALQPLEREQSAYLLADLPDVILEQPEKLRLNIQELQEAFSLSQKQLSDLIVKNPKLILRQIDLTQHDLFVLSNYIGVPIALTTQLVVHHPHLLGASWQTVKAHFDKLCTFFDDMPRETVVQLVIQNPSLLPLLNSTQRPDV